MTMPTSDSMFLYAFVTTLLLIFCAKDYVILTFLTLVGKLCTSPRNSHVHPQCRTISATQEKKHSSRIKSLITCKEISDILIDHFLGWIALYILIITPALKYAFVSVPCTGTGDIEILLGIQIAKLIFKSFFTGFVTRRIFSCLHNVILSACSIGFLFSGTTGVIGVIGLVWDMADAPLHVEKVLDTWKVSNCSRGRYATIVVGLVFTVCFRCFCPMAFIIYAVANDSPTYMKTSDLALFFIFLTYSAAVNTFLLFSTITKLKESRRVRTLYKSATVSDYNIFPFNFATAIKKTKWKTPEPVYSKPDVVVLPPSIV